MQSSTLHALARGRHSPLNVLRRSTKACDRCRKRRTKCLGEPPHPCVPCSNAGHTCIYTESQKKVMVSETYLVELQAQARRATATIVGADVPSSEDGTTPDIELSFTGTDNWVVGSSGEYHFMGNSSSTYIANRLNPTAETLAWHKYPHYDDTSWTKRLNNPALPQLPPFEIAKRLFASQHAYIGTIFSFLTESAFDARLQLVYSRSMNPANQEERLIYCQVLLALAFGQMYSINQWVSKEGPPGFTYFKHALDFLPNIYEEGSILFIEVLSYVAYFMQTINRRDAAYLMIGTALRMAISLGLHQEVSDQDIDYESREHRRRVWWSTYSMDRLLSVTSGHPLSIQDEDIDVLLPGMNASGDESSSTLALYTELSKIQGMIGEKIYRKKQKSGVDLSACIQQIMKRLSSWFESLPESIRSNPPDSGTMPSREVVSTYLHYYHCINMTARPILLYAVQRNLGPNAQSLNPDNWQEGLSPSIVNVIDRAISAARSSASILHAAAQYNLVATYGFIDGEQAFSAAMLLVMVNIAFPYNETNASAMGMALGVLQSMADQGNSYIRACLGLLTKIRGAINPAQPSRVAIERGNSRRSEAGSGPAQEIPNSGNMVSEILADESQHELNFEDDPHLWAEVLDSMNIDMDRQWVETAFRNGQHFNVQL